MMVTLMAFRGAPFCSTQIHSTARRRRLGGQKEAAPAMYFFGSERRCGHHIDKPLHFVVIAPNGQHAASVAEAFLLIMAS